MISSREIGESVKKRRKERKLSQESAAELSGVSRNFIKGLEKGNPNLRLDLLLRVLDLLGLELELKDAR